METMGERIKKLRKAKKLSIVALADTVDMTTQNLWNLENDMVGKTFEKLAPLAKALGCRIDDLFPEMDEDAAAPAQTREESKTVRACGFDENEDLKGWSE